MISASAPYTSGWGGFVLLKMDSVRVARGGSLSMLHQGGAPIFWEDSGPGGYLQFFRGVSAPGGCLQFLQFLGGVSNFLGSPIF